MAKKRPTTGPGACSQGRRMLPFLSGSMNLPLYGRPAPPPHPPIGAVFIRFTLTYAAYRCWTSTEVGFFRVLHILAECGTSLLWSK